jgi:hypothetical protein
MMQHYGVPTRLLDFTSSPYVALYFALEAYNPQTQKDLSVYALDFTAVIEKSIQIIRAARPDFVEDRRSVYQKQDQIFEEIVGPGNYEVLWITEPKKVNARLDRQAGCFLLSGNKGKKLLEILDSEPYKDCAFEKFIIDKGLYTAVFALLRKMNITSKSIYGDLTGLARSIRMEMQIYAS